MTKHAKRIQRYVNHSSIEDALATGDYDIVQPKLDGWWACCVVDRGTASIYSRTGQLQERRKAPGVRPCVVIGEWLVGTQRATSDAESGHLVVFDAISVGGGRWSGRAGDMDVRRLGYQDRMGIVATQHGSCFGLPWVRSVKSSPATAASARSLWRRCESGELEGVVFRRSTDTYQGATIGRVKRTVTADYVVMGTERGTGRYAHTLGCLICGVFRGDELVETVRIGGGFSDAVRDDMWRRRKQLIGRVVEARGHQLFESGALRHPQFSRWREDKVALDCVVVRKGGRL